jgi:hypothetical protein
LEEKNRDSEEGFVPKFATRAPFGTTNEVLLPFEEMILCFAFGIDDEIFYIRVNDEIWVESK